MTSHPPNYATVSPPNYKSTPGLSVEQYTHDNQPPIVNPPTVVIRDPQAPTTLPRLP